MSLHTPSAVFTTWRSTPFSFVSVSIEREKNYVHLVTYLYDNNSNLVISRCCFAEESKNLYCKERRPCRSYLIASHAFHVLFTSC